MSRPKQLCSRCLKNEPETHLFIEGRWIAFCGGCEAVLLDQGVIS